jgi:hypothetical protein
VGQGDDRGCLIHYSAEPLTAVESVLKPWPHHRVGKPPGLWVSVETGNEDGWRDWCISEKFGLERLAHATRVTLKPDANILWAKDRWGILQIVQNYRNANARQWSYDGIDWGKVMQAYQGVVIAPYVWQCRLEMWCEWYYTWDCASGCLWNADAVASLTPAPEFAYVPQEEEPA